MCFFEYFLGKNSKKQLTRKYCYNIIPKCGDVCLKVFHQCPGETFLIYAKLFFVIFSRRLTNENIHGQFIKH